MSFFSHFEVTSFKIKVTHITLSSHIIIFQVSMKSKGVTAFSCLFSTFSKFCHQFISETCRQFVVLEQQEF